MFRPFRKSAGRTRRRRLPIAAGLAALMVAGIGQPLLVSAQAEDQPVDIQPLIDALNGNYQHLGESLAAANDAYAALAEGADDLANQLATLPTGLATDPSATLAALQATVASSSLSIGFTAVLHSLRLTSAVLAPTCSTLGAITATAPILGTVPALLYGPLAPVIGQLDRGVSDALLSAYTQIFTKVLTPATLPAGSPELGSYTALATAVVGLLKMNWQTTYYPPGGGAPIVRNTPGLLGLPTFLDVDGRTGVDLCGTMGMDLTSILNAGSDPTALTKLSYNQTISRLPLAQPDLAVDVKGQYLDTGDGEFLVSPGYATKGSKAPASFTTSGPLLATGVTSSLLKPGPTFDQTYNLSSAFEVRESLTKPPAWYSLTTKAPRDAAGANPDGLLLNYTGLTKADKFAWKVSTIAKGDTPTDPDSITTAAVGQTPAATQFEYCTSGKGHCSNETNATDKAAEVNSMHFKANETVKVEQTWESLEALPGQAPVRVDGTPADGCTLLPAPITLPEPLPPATFGPADARLIGRELYIAHSGSLTKAAGHAYVDTRVTGLLGPGAPGKVSGCLSTGGNLVTSALAGAMNANFPADFDANQRVTRWSGLIPSILTSRLTTPTPRTGTATCSAGMWVRAIFNVVDLSLCPQVPMVGATLPVISGTAVAGQTLSIAMPSGWTPLAPNAPSSYSLKWERETAPGVWMTVKGPTTMSALFSSTRSYTLVAADKGRNIRAVVVGTNFDGPSAPVNSAPVAVAP